MKQIYYILITVLLLPTLSACTDWLNLEPEDGVVRQKFWKTKEEAKSVLMGCYASMMDEDMMLRYFLWGEMRADFVTPTSKANDEIISIRNGEIVPSNQYTQWDGFYKTINMCNTVIELAPQAQKYDPSFSESTLKQYQAEAVCVRSLMYFYLIRTFRDVPYVVNASIYDYQNYSPVKSTQKEILNHLVEDLLSVEEDLPFSYDTNIENKGRFTRWGLKALLADIYLWNENYAACNDLCNQIIQSGQFSLVPVSRSQSTALNESGETVPVYTANVNEANTLFKNMYVDGNSVESIFELQFSTGLSNPYVKWLKPVSGYLAAKTEELSKFFVKSELTRDWRDIRADYSWKSESVWKWIGLTADGAEYRGDASSYSNWIFYRLADVILMKADALTQLAAADNNQTQLQEAYNLVEEIRERSNATEMTSYETIYGKVDDNFNSNNMEEFILDERGRELVFEGKRWFDLIRYVERNNAKNINYLSAVAVRSTIPEKVSILQNKWLNSSGSHYLPIYSEEIKMNKNLEQNEFYK